VIDGEQGLLQYRFGGAVHKEARIWDPKESYRFRLGRGRRIEPRAADGVANYWEVGSLTVGSSRA
jgi:hypothetical protein